MICVNQVSCDINKHQLVPSLSALWNQTPFAHLNFLFDQTVDGERVRSIKGLKGSFKRQRAFFKICKEGIQDDETALNRLMIGAEERMTY